MKGKSKLLILFLGFLVYFPLVLAFNQTAGIHLLNPQSPVSLGSADLSFYSCADQAPLHSLFCDDDLTLLELPQIQLGNCTFTSLDLATLDCSKFRLLAITNSSRYELPMRLFKTFTDPSLIIQQQHSDGGFANPIDTALAIWFMSHFKGYDEQIQHALTWLKKNRDNTFKCWPKEKCDVFTTAKVLAYLNLAGINTSNKVVYDGIAWLEDRQNYIQKSNWIVSVESDSGNINCSLAINGATKTFDITEDTPYTLNITMDYGTTFNLSCSETAIFTLKNHLNETIFMKKSNARIIYDFPKGACWSLTQWDSCDIPTTIYAVMSAINETRKAKAKEFLAASLKDDLIFGRYLPVYQHHLYTALYYKYIDPDESLLNYLVFQQNNDGSWGANTSDQYLLTIHVLNALLNATSYSYVNEPIQDAKLWLSEHVSVKGLQDIEKDSHLFFILQNTEEQLLKGKPPLLILTNESATLQVINPTPFNFTNLTLSNEPELVSFEPLNNLSAYEKREITVTKKQKEAGIYFSLLTIKSINGSNHTKTLVTLPLIVNTTPMLKVTAPATVTFLGKETTLPLTITANGNFYCEPELDTSLIKTKGFTITPAMKDYALPLSTEEAQRRTIPFELHLHCKLDNAYYPVTLTKTFSLTAEQYPENIFAVMPEEITLEKKHELTVQNLLGEPLTITLFLKKPDEWIQYPEEIRLKPFEKKAISIAYIYDGKENKTEENVLFLTGVDKVSVPLHITYTYVPFFASTTFAVIKFFVLALILLIIAYFAYLYSDYALVYGKYYGKLLTFHLQQWYSQLIKQRSKQKKLIKPELIQTTKKEKKSFKDLLTEWYAKIPSDVKKTLHLPESIGKKEEKESVEEDLMPKRTGVEELIKVMKQLGKSEKEIKKELKAQGMTDDEIGNALLNVKMGMEQEEELKKEEDVINVIKAIEKKGDEVRDALKKLGFTDEQITETFEELEEEVEEKEKTFEEKLKALQGEEEEKQESTSLLDMQKQQQKNS